MNVMRIMILVVFGVFLMNMVLCLSSGESPRESILNMVENVAEVLVLGCGIITYDLALARAIGKGKAYGRRYTRIMVPSFVFILFADIFFLIVSFFNGGLFRGWLRRKRPSKG